MRRDGSGGEGREGEGTDRTKSDRDGYYLESVFLELRSSVRKGAGSVTFAGGDASDGL
jgi:hypothetical protein